MKPLPKLLLLLIIFYTSIAKGAPKPGYRVTLKGDTLKGYIDYKEWDNNPASFKFADSPTSKFQTFDLDNTNAFGVNGLEHFEKHMVSISMNSTKFSDVSIVVDSNKRTDIVFLKIITKGKYINLYSYTDDLKIRYYYSETGSNKINEYTHYVYQVKSNSSNASYAEINSAGQLNQLALKYNPAIASQTDKIEYDKDDMLKITRLINGNQEDDQFKIASKLKTSFFAGIGGSYSTIKFTDLAALVHPDIDKNTLLPYVTAGIDIYPNKFIQRFLIKLQLNFVPDQHELYSALPDFNGDITTTSLNFKQYTINFLPQLIYNFYNRPNLKIYAGTGVSFNLSFYNDYKYITYYKTNFTSSTNATKFPKFDSLWITFPITAGAVINNRIGVNLYYFLPGSITNYSGISGNVTSYRAGVSYMFGR